MSWFFTILFLSLTFCGLSEAEHHQKKHHTSAAVVVGTVYCDTCFQQDFSKNSHFIPGASVVVECKDENFKKQVKTNEHGEFKVALPFTVSKHVKKIERCSVELVSSSEPFCAVASSATSSSLHLKARKEGVHVFSAGFFTFKPLKQPVLCNQKPSVQRSSNLSNKKIDTGIGPSKDIPFPPPLQDPPVPGVLPPLPLLPKLPPLPELPLLPPLQRPSVQGSSDLSNKKIDTGTGPSKDIPFPPPTQDPPVPGLMPPLPVLPKLPPLPELPLLPPLPKLPNLPPMPWTKSQTVDQKVAQPDNFPRRLPTTIFPPFPFLPPPIPVLQPPPILPPNPLLPPPAPLIPIPPNPLQPPPSPLIPIPPVPGLTPSPPPPAFPIPLPPFPFPRPSFPGIPPASTTP